MKTPKFDGSALVKDVPLGFIALLKKASAGANGELCRHPSKNAKQFILKPMILDAV